MTELEHWMQVGFNKADRIREAIHAHETESAWQCGDVVLDANSTIWSRANEDDAARGWPWRSGAETTMHGGQPYAGEGGSTEGEPVRPLTLLVRNGQAVQTVIAS